MIKEIKAHDLNTEKFITEKVNEIRAAVGSDMAIVSQECAMANGTSGAR